jgi:carbon storage regulator
MLVLVLSRKLGEKIYIGDNICITVVDIDRGKIRLGIEAPRDVPIYRQELLPLLCRRRRSSSPFVFSGQACGRDGSTCRRCRSFHLERRQDCAAR